MTKSDDSTFRKHDTLPIAIVGGGLGGLALAIGLVKHGIKVHIYEAAAAFSEVGAGVAFGVNSTTALRLIDPKLFEGYMKHATFNSDRNRDNTFFSGRWGMDERKEGGHKAGDFMWDLNDALALEKANGARTRSCIHRARLLEELVALLPKDITTFSKSFEDVKELKDGTLQLRFADGTHSFASAVIGCDGIKSKVREFVFGPHVQATYAGECAYRAMVAKADVEAVLGSELAGNGQMYCGYDGYIITYPVEDGQFVNMVAIPRDPSKIPTWDQDDWTVPSTIVGFQERFTGWYRPLIDVFSRFLSPLRWALFTVSHDAPYFKSRICLLGDSAHATTPHLGAGAGMAMEDAYILSSLVASVTDVIHVEDAFRAYDAVRRPRTQQCIERSMSAIMAYSFNLHEIADNTDALKEHLEDSYRWLWHEDLEAQMQRGIQLLTESTVP